MINKIFEIGIPLTEFGINELAFPLKNFNEIISFYLQSNIIIFGGDILDNAFEYTYDNWYYNPDINISHKENLTKSYMKAKAYLESYPNKSAYFIIVPTLEL